MMKKNWIALWVVLAVILVLVLISFVELSIIFSQLHPVVQALMAATASLEAYPGTVQNLENQISNPVTPTPQPLPNGIPLRSIEE